MRVSVWAHVWVAGCRGEQRAKGTQMNRVSFLSGLFCFSLATSFPFPPPYLPTYQPTNRQSLPPMHLEARALDAFSVQAFLSAKPHTQKACSRIDDALLLSTPSSAGSQARVYRLDLTADVLVVRYGLAQH